MAKLDSDRTWVAAANDVSVDPYSPGADESPGLNRTWLDHVDGSPTPNKPAPVFKPVASTPHTGGIVFEFAVMLSQ